MSLWFYLTVASPFWSRLLHVSSVCPDTWRTTLTRRVCLPTGRSHLRKLRNEQDPHVASRGGRDVLQCMRPAQDAVGRRRQVARSHSGDEQPAAPAGQRTSISNNQELGSPLGGHKPARGIAPAAQWNVAAGHFARTSRETIARMTPPRNEVSCNFDPRMTCRGTKPGMRSRRAPA